MKSSVITKYFGTCSAVILSSIVCLGSVFLIATLQLYKTEKKEALLASADEMTAATELSFSEDGSLNSDKIKIIYDEYSKLSGYDIALVGEYGETLVRSESADEITGAISGSTLAALPPEKSFSTGNFDGYLTDTCFVTITPFTMGEIGYYMVVYVSTEAYYEYIRSIVTIFAAIFAVSAALTFIILYFVTRNMMKPVSEMTAAAERFGKGDFSKKLDISESNEFGTLAASMNNMAYSLAGFEKSRKSFIANVSHELKTPMTSIGGFVDGILDGTIPQSQQKHYLTLVSEEINRLSRMVRSMLNISKYESGEIKMKLERFDITALTVKTVLLFEKRIGDRHVDVLGLDTDPHYIMADEDLVQQIIYNLVENAIKFVNIGGYISFGFEEKDGKIRVSVRNSGGGLTEEEIPRVFDRFYKTDESHGKDKTGVGLGLAIVRSIINLHGGSILVKSTPGEYTEFSFLLPLAPSAHGKDKA